MTTDNISAANLSTTLIPALSHSGTRCTCTETNGSSNHRLGPRLDPQATSSKPRLDRARTRRGTGTRPRTAPRAAIRRHPFTRPTHEAKAVYSSGMVRPFPLPYSPRTATQTHNILTLDHFFNSNECKRRKIKCNGEKPCERCSHLNVGCIYSSTCCNGFSDSVYVLYLLSLLSGSHQLFVSDEIGAKANTCA